MRNMLVMIPFFCILAAWTAVTGGTVDERPRVGPA